MTVILTLHNESGTLGRMYERLKNVVISTGVSHELLFVDDCSHDGTVSLVSHLARMDAMAKPVFLAPPRGKEAALRVGLAQARGRAVIIMAADDPPELIPEMLKAWRNGAQAVLMRPMLNRHGTALNRLGSRISDYIAHVFADSQLPENSMDFMLYDRRVLIALNLTVDRKRYMKAIFSWMGLRQTVIKYERHPRAAGTPLPISMLARYRRPCRRTAR